MHTYTLTIPAPCAWLSANDRRHWAQQQRLVREWRAAAYIAARAARLPKTLRRVRIDAELRFRSNRRRDAPNYYSTLKPIVDGLAASPRAGVPGYGLILDDTPAYLDGPHLTIGEPLKARRGFTSPGVVIVAITDLSGEASLMARSEARIYTAIWDDPDFLALSMAEQWMYLFLLSQADLEYTGVVAIRARRWARRAGRPVEELHASLEALALAGFVVVDDDSEELLIRSFIRRDEVYRQPNLMKSVVRGLVAVESPVIRSMILAELQRIEADHADQIPNGSRAPIAAAMGSLKASTYPPNGQRAMAEEGIREPFREGFDEGIAEGLGEPLGLGSGVGEGVGVLTLRTSKASSSFETESSTNDSDTTAVDAVDDEPVREDVEALCTRLAEWVIKNGNKPPTVGKRWHDAARRLLDIDKRDLNKALALIDWCQQDEFWQGVVKAMPKFREQYDTLRHRATTEWKRGHTKGGNRFELPASTAPERIPESEKCEHLKRATTCGLCRAEREGATQ